jgi:hypothetical protein
MDLRETRTRRRRIGVLVQERKRFILAKNSFGHRMLMLHREESLLAFACTFSYPAAGRTRVNEMEEPFDSCRP